MDFDIFSPNVTDKVSNQKTLNCATSNNLRFCTTCQNRETRKITFFTQLDCVTHNAPVRCFPERKNCHLGRVW